MFKKPVITFSPNFNTSTQIPNLGEIQTEYYKIAEKEIYWGNLKTKRKINNFGEW